MLKNRLAGNAGLPGKTSGVLAPLAASLPVSRPMNLCFCIMNPLKDTMDFNDDFSQPFFDFLFAFFDLKKMLFEQGKLGSQAACSTNVGAGEGNRIPVVVLTASAQDRDLQLSKRLGAEACIIKPVDLQNLSRVAPQLKLHWALLKSSVPARATGAK